MRPPVRALGAAVVTAAVLPVAACSGPGAPDARAAALDFVRTVRHDPQGACRMLAPRTADEVAGDASCAEGLRQADLPDAGAVRSVEVAGHSAQVRLEHDTVFLALFDDGWKVTAAGCTADDADAETPYDCTVKGG